MIFNMVGGGGSGKLGLSVKAYASADALPTSEAENAIAVITSTAIAKFVLSPIEPTSKTTGTVWITINGGDVAIGVDEEDIITLYPDRCVQWDGSQWVNCDAFVYQSAKWVAFAEAVLYLYSPGNTHESLTGGWISEGKKSASSGGGVAKASAISEGAESIVFTLSGDDYLANVTYMKNPINLTDYSKISMTANRTTGTNMFCVWTSIGTYGSQNTVVYKAIASGSDVLEYDVSGLSGNHYIGFLMGTGSGTSSVITLTELKLLPM